MAEMVSLLAAASIAKISAAEDYDNRSAAFQAADDLVATYMQLAGIFSRIESRWSGVSFLDKYKSRYADLRPVIAAAVRAIRARAAGLAVENREVLDRQRAPDSHMRPRIWSR